MSESDKVKVMPIRLIDCLVFNANFSSISAILWREQRK